MVSTLRFPWQFEPPLLQADVAGLDAQEWVRHFNTQYYEGEWSGVALRSVGGGSAQLYQDPTADAFADTAVLARCPNLRAALAVFQCPLKSVRLLKLAAGARILEHRDYDLGFELGELRVHVPIVTHPDVDFFLDGARLTMGEGESWYLDLNRPHRVHNRSTIDRVHLVIDCVLNDWLLAYFPQLSNRPPITQENRQFSVDKQMAPTNNHAMLKTNAAFTPAVKMILEQLTQEKFAECVGSKFRLPLEPGGSVEIELIEAVKIESRFPRHASLPKRAPFSLVFRGPKDLFLPQQTYAVEHDKLGKFDLFLVPIMPDQEGPRHEAVFN